LSENVRQFLQSSKLHEIILNYVEINDFVMYLATSTLSLRCLLCPMQWFPRAILPLGFATVVIFMVLH